MRSKLLGLAFVSFLALAALQGCSSDPPKSGVPIQKDDYSHAPGGGAANPNAAAPKGP